MTTRRSIIGGIGAATIGSTSGCLGFLTGSEPLEESARPARVQSNVSESTGYELQGIEEQTLEETFEIAGQERTVIATNAVATYEKALEIPLLGEARTGVFAVVSTPAFEIAGQSLNPVSNYDEAELVELVASQYEGLRVGSQRARTTATTLGSDYEVAIFAGTATFQGQEVDVNVHTGSLRHEDDFLIPVGIYPQERADRERAHVETLLDSLEHPVDA
ncbi:hypothetical protein SAMN05192561_10685 [Halopenitus malekzadehii]|uniref:Uncharacterized protein n=1 Tax=Halopenitus malekzadehii TaxID=1267564 RepID=A0A1H6J7C2_9EURY|nr:DUF6517 family protein [Halopenitus malekzadehii]SEH55443.1 hypothetical protein SAMN05192561_10685 [Halopenitus malekzadehii]